MNEKFVMIHASQLVEFLNKGYEIVTSYEETYTSTRFINGYFMNNPISITDFPVSEVMTKYVLKRSPNAEVLYGEDVLYGN